VASSPWTRRWSCAGSPRRRSEADLLAWAEKVSPGRIRRRGDLEARRSREQAERVQSCRELCLSYEEEGTTGELDGRLPAAEMAVVQARLEQVASTLPVMPGEQDRSFHSARLADALVAVCRGEGAGSTGTTIMVPWTPWAPVSARPRWAPAA
jgi:hypothetical protein